MVSIGWKVTLYLVLSFLLFLITSFTIAGWMIIFFFTPTVFGDCPTDLVDCDFTKPYSTWSHPLLDLEYCFRIASCNDSGCTW